MSTPEIESQFTETDLHPTVDPS